MKDSAVIVNEVPVEDDTLDGGTGPGEDGGLDGGTGSREGVAEEGNVGVAAQAALIPSGYRDARGRLLPGNPLASVGGLASRRDQATIEAIKGEFHPAKVVSMINSAWASAESRNSPHAKIEIAELILNYLVGKPTQYTVSSRLDPSSWLTMLASARVPDTEGTET